MKLATQRLLIRPIRLSDTPSQFELATAENVSVFAGFPHPTSLADTRKWVRLMIREAKMGKLARRQFTLIRREDGAWLGGITLRWPHGGVAEIGYAIHPRHQGNGYATEAARRVVDWAFTKFGAHRVQATCWVKNPKSARVLRKAGLRKEGILRGFLKKNGVARDEFIFGMTRQDHLKGR